MKLKKITALLIAAALLVGVTACGNNSTNPDNPSDVTSGDTSSDTPSDTTADSGASSEVTSDPLEFLNGIWDSYSDDDKFPAAGGNGDGNLVDGAPGNFAFNASEIDRLLGYPEGSADKIDSVASLFHMMNLNTFTAGAYHLKDASDAADLAQAVRDDIQARRWMCGFPDKLIVVNVGSMLVSAFGNEDLINTFRDKIVAVYPDATVSFDEAIQ